MSSGGQRGRGEAELALILSNSGHHTCPGGRGGGVTEGTCDVKRKREESGRGGVGAYFQ